MNIATTESVVNGGIGLGSASFLVLMVLKVLGLIDMGWFWVLSSILWVPLATFAATMLLMAAGMFVFMLIAYAWGKLFGSGA